MSLCKDCHSGVIHEGTPKGKVEKVGGIDTYVALPTVDYPKDKAVLFLPDVLGIHMPNSQLLADSFAGHGFAVYMPDYLNGDPVPTGFMNDSSFDINKWFVNHGADVTLKPLNACIEGLKAQGITTFGATGYCFGGKYAVILAQNNTLKAATMAHPSLLEVPGDFEKLLASSSTPIQICAAELDYMFNTAQQDQVDQMLGGGKYKPGFEQIRFEGCAHAFAVRGDLNDPKVKAGKEGAFEAAVKFLHKYL